MKKVLIKQALIQIVGKTIGLRAVLLAKLVSFFMDKLILPGFDFLARKGIMVIREREIKISIKQLKEAQNETDLDRSIDDLA